MDTIFAQATSPGRSGVAVIRLSGERAFDAARILAGDLPPEREVALRQLCFDGEILDSALVVVFHGPRSFTGEDVVELHCHGSLAVVASVLRALGQCEGLRIAEPGEFSRRALENGKMDLTQVEGLADLLEAQTEAQRRQAQLSLSGALSARVESWRVDVIRAAALLEAVMDFADEDVPSDVSVEVLDLIVSVEGSIGEAVRGWAFAERVRDGFEVAIVGEPNVGKSTLLNALAGRDAAITSEFAGTTRDVIEVQMDLDGIPVLVLDTAGLRATDDPVELIGVGRAFERAERADLRIFLADELADGFPEFVEGDIHVKPKGDLRAQRSGCVSGLTGLGVDGLVKAISRSLRERVNAAGLVNRERHVSACRDALVCLERARKSVLLGDMCYDLAAEELRCVVRRLESLIGRVDVEDLLGEIFSSFCVGK